MSRPARLTAVLLTEHAARATGLVDLLRRLGRPVSSGNRSYLSRRLRHLGVDTEHFAPEEVPRLAPRSYTREALSSAAAKATSIRGMFEHLGYATDQIPYSLIRRKLAEFGIDTTHFGRSGLAPPAAPERVAGAGVVANAVRSSTGLAGVLRELGLPDNTNTRRRLRAQIAAQQLPTAHFTGQGHQRGRPSPARRSADEILRCREPSSPRLRTRLLRRALDDSEVPRVCVLCGTGETWQGRKLVLEIDHINGLRHDDRRENLRYLCPNCHATTASWCRGAKGEPGGAIT